MPPDQWSLRSFGPPLPSVEVKLADHPSLNYSTHTTPPRGQIFIRGPSVPDKGYFGGADASPSATPDDGWVDTREIGEWNPLFGKSRSEGLTIIDRVKPLEGRFHGDYVPLKKLQAVYETCEFVEACCLIYAGRKVKPVAVICTPFPPC
jgi:long-chain acyl-CoA synthetase